jgi:hypothetical protein
MSMECKLVVRMTLEGCEISKYIPLFRLARSPHLGSLMNDVVARVIYRLHW